REVELATECSRFFLLQSQSVYRLIYSLLAARG
ncbi:hypothetical protein VEx25_A0351, partial [Vibrio antiquarius]